MIRLSEPIFISYPEATKPQRRTILKHLAEKEAKEGHLRVSEEREDAPV